MVFFFARSRSCWSPDLLQYRKFDSLCVATATTALLFCSCLSDSRLRPVTSSLFHSVVRINELYVGVGVASRRLSIARNIVDGAGL